ncbi:pig-Q [Malassezia sp. CBS 17886]|nr:pig-Q [Malassezia sp. CBS 17886]
MTRVCRSDDHDARAESAIWGPDTVDTRLDPPRGLACIRRVFVYWPGDATNSLSKDSALRLYGWAIEGSSDLVFVVAGPIGCRHVIETCERLEQLLAMDPECWASGTASQSTQLGAILPLLNSARWSLTAPPRPRTMALWRVFGRACVMLAVPLRLVGRGGSGVILLACDMALGGAAGAAMNAHCDTLACAMERALHWPSAPVLHTVLEWLAHWPLGIKLNTELARFLTDTLAWLVDVHTAYVLGPVRAHTYDCVHAGAWIARLGGLSLLLSVAHDGAYVAFAHIAITHVLLQRVFHFAVFAAGALFDLFRGKKRNPLYGGRVDAAHYEVDQLFLGAILFTLVVLLLPTLLLYYACAAAAQLGVLGVRVSLSVLAAVLNSLPLYDLVIGAIDPLSLPGGVVFEEGVAEGPLRGSLRTMRSCMQPLGVTLATAGRQTAPVRALPQLVLDALLVRPLVVPWPPAGKAEAEADNYNT